MRFVRLESVKSTLEENQIPFEEYKDWSDEQVVDKLLHLLREKPRRKLREAQGVQIGPNSPLYKYAQRIEPKQKVAEEKLEEFVGGHFVSLARALGDCQASQAVEPLRRALSSSDKYVVAAASRALGKIGDVSVVDKLKPLLSHEEKRVRMAAAEGLARLGQPEGLDTLRQRMKEREAWREEGIQLRDFLEVDCAKILYELGDSSGARLLVEYLKHPSFYAVSFALSALETITAPECVQAVREHLSREADADNILKCVRILARLGDLSELHRVTEILVVGKPKERQWAAETCSKLGFTVFLEPLHKRLETEGHMGVRKSIEQAIHCIKNSPVSVETLPLEVEEPLQMITRLGQKILQNPSDKVAWERKAEEEVYYFTVQLEKGGNRLEALRRLGFAYLFGPFGYIRISKAQNCFKQVLTEKPDDPVALFGLARTQIMWRGGCNEERKSMLLRAKAGCRKPFVNLYDWPGNDIDTWLARCV